MMKWAIAGLSAAINASYSPRGSSRLLGKLAHDALHQFASGLFAFLPQSTQPLNAAMDWNVGSAIPASMPAIPAWPPASTPRLFVDQPLDLSAQISIEGAAAHYLIHVMRLKVGDPILLFNNSHGEWLALATDIGKKSANFSIERQMRAQENVPDLWLCFAPIKKARLDYIIEKATELGISRLQPVITERTIVERVKQERLAAQIIEACEQCGRTALPDLADPIKLPRLLQSWPTDRALLFADEEGGIPFPQIHAPAPAAILIGPEGGFTDKERAALLSHTAVHRMALGPRILRAETAAIAAVSLWMGQHGDWG